MQHEQIVRGQVVEVEELEDLVAVMPGDPDRRAEVLEPAEQGADVVGPDLDAQQLAAFEKAGWIFARSSSRLSGAAASRTEVDGVAAVQRVFRKANGRLALGTDKIAVRLRDELSEAEVGDVLSNHGVTAVKRLRFAPNLFEVRVAPGADFLQVSRQLAEDPAVEFAEPQFIEHIPGRYTPSDPRYAQQWHLNNTGQLSGTAGADIRAERAWDLTKGSGVTVAVVDNGFNVGHPDLAAAVLPGSGYFASDPNGDTVFRNTLVNYPEVMEPLNSARTIFGHGTFCAGMALARADNGIGVCGVAPEAGFLAVACLGDQVGTQATLARAIAYAADPSLEVEGLSAADGADVISCSLGPNGADWDMSQTLQTALDFAVTHGRGGRGTPIFWAVTNGNFEIRHDEVCSYSATIAVGRSTRNDTEHGCGSGPELDFLAGGVDVLSTATGPTGDAAYGISTGTSFAAPTAAGVGALALAANPDLGWQEVRDLVRRTCERVGGVTYDANGHHDDYGFGRVDAAAAVEQAIVRPPASFQQVCQILDDSIGGPGVGIAVHGAFWRGLTRDQFVARKVLGLDLVVVGNGAQSNLVRALRGEPPFGANLPNPPAGATFNRMPTGRPPVPPASIAVIEQWINAGCPEDPQQPAVLSWHPTNAPEASSRTDDIWFRTPELGWAVNSNGQILQTTDGGGTWTQQFHGVGVYLRCVGFASDTRGWVGTLTGGDQRLLETTDGGANWSFVTGLPALAPLAVCGLSVVDENVAYASGTNFPNVPARMMRTIDGGATWTGWDMGEHATLLVDVMFTDADHGWVVGGKAAQNGPTTTRDQVRAIVLRTEDGGTTWTNKLAGMEAQLPLGEWGWKIHFLNQDTGFVALESFTRGAILRTDDGGQTWTRLDINDQQGNVNLEGVGFVDEQTGWVGGWGTANFLGGFSSATTDGGQTWTNANEIGRFINRFRFLGNPVTVGYASGLTVYKYSAEPPVRAAAAVERVPGTRLMASNAPLRSGRPLRLPVTVPDGAQRLIVAAWSRFGEELGLLVDESTPAVGPREVVWEPPVDLPSGAAVLIRVSVDDTSESRIVQLI